MIDDGQDSETLSGSQAPTISGSPPSGPSSPPVALFRPSLPVGEKFGSYRLLRPLGKGGMGEVYEAEHEETRRRVALKVLSRGLEDPTDRARFLREGRLAASVSHPNSVYIYGTEEIEGTAVIAMELVLGGTLKDRVERDGPMPPREGVDAILQVVDGLEAAAARGVLHRDIKPSNCFVSEGGVLKIGDYGLSMSMLSRADSHLTQTGTFLGTPAFASPEQVRGDTIDVRSDIYSVGATLYYLVTGRAPFEGGGVGKLLSSVLERAPEPPRRLRPEVPRGLERAILRCLEKEPKARFSSYPALREALLPYGTTAPTPGTLGLRFAAGAADTFILNLPWWLPDFFHGVQIGAQEAQRPRNSAALSGGGYLRAAYLFVWAAELLYFTLLEGLWGASIGKRILGLRVHGSSGVAPGLPRALLRTAVWQSTGLAALAVAFALGRRGSVESIADSWIANISNLLFLLLLFVTARRANGFAGLHDLVSGTRVVRKHALRRRPIPTLGLRPGPLQESPGHQIGRYAVVSSLLATEEGSLLLGYDEQLRRNVWIHVRRPPGPPELPAVRRALARPTRLRWLEGRRAERECWDAYEAPEGALLAEKLNERIYWESARFWLFDLVDELETGLKDQTIPSELGLDRIWIGADGRAKVLDFRVSDRSDADSERVAVRDFATMQAFVHCVCLALLRGPVPLHARSFADGLARRIDTDPQALAESLRGLLGREASVSPQRRAACVLICCILMLPLLAVIGGIFAALQNVLLNRGHPDFPKALAAVAFVSFAPVVVAWLSAFLLRGGLLLRLFGFAMVTRDGVQVSRLRAGLRSFAGWSFWWLAGSVLIGAWLLSVWRFDVKSFFVTAILTLALLAGAAIWEAWAHPVRGIADRIAGTYLVPR